MELLRIGCTGEELVNAVNDIISAINEYARPTSYLELSDKPKINGVDLTEDSTTQTLKIKVAETEDYSTLGETFVTNKEIANFETNVMQEVSSLVNTALENKMDKNMSELEEVSVANDQSTIYISASDGSMKRITLATLARLVETKSIATKTSVETAVAKERKVMTLEGDKDGTNVTYSVKGGYRIGTSALYLNGQLLTIDVDYIESSSYDITMLTHIPISSDILVFIAVSTS